MSKKDKASILILDQKANRRDTLASRFRLQGYVVEIASSPFQALSMLETDLFDTFLIIGQTYEMPTFEVISLSRNLFDKKELQIIYSDPRPKEEDILTYSKLGMSHFLVWSDKIFAPLLNKIEEFKPPANRKPGSLLKDFSK